MPVSHSQLNVIAPQSGVAFRLGRGDLLRVIDPQGEQVADLMCFATDDVRDSLSSGRSIDYAERLYLSVGDILYSAGSRPMLTIERDDVGRHDFLLTPCSQQTFEIIYGHVGPHPSCLQNLSTALEPFGISPEAIGTTFNIFMNVEIDTSGKIAVRPPRSRPGDCIEMRANMDLIVSLTACSAEQSNNFRFKPIHYAIERFTA
jgi:uncharacterized protein YcgI (DUF1989 family)